MKINRKLRCVINAALAALILVAAFVIIARTCTVTDQSEADYEVTGLDMRIAVSKDHTYEVDEYISVDIPQDLQKAEFALAGGSSGLKDLTVEGEKAKAARRNSGRYVVISDPELLTAGHHRYRIMYKLTARKDKVKDKDVFSFDVIPEGWNCPVYKLHALLWFPYGFPLEEIQVYTDEAPVLRQTIKIEPQSRSFTVGITGVPEDFHVRLEAELPDGYWE